MPLVVAVERLQLVHLKSLAPLELVELISSDGGNRGHVNLPAEERSSLCGETAQTIAKTLTMVRVITSDLDNGVMVPPVETAPDIVGCHTTWTKTTFASHRIRMVLVNSN